MFIAFMQTIRTEPNVNKTKKKHCLTFIPGAPGSPGSPIGPGRPDSPDRPGSPWTHKSVNKHSITLTRLWNTNSPQNAWHFVRNIAEWTLCWNSVSVIWLHHITLTHAGNVRMRMTHRWKWRYAVRMEAISVTSLRNTHAPNVKQSLRIYWLTDIATVHEGGNLVIVCSCWAYIINTQSKPTQWTCRLRHRGMGRKSFE